jgi:Xaa-Pro aminopeptidase
MGHRAAMAAAGPGVAEYEVQAVLEAEFRRHGSPRTGYGSIVASGPNACILHYHDNDRTMRAGELLLIDAGTEYGGYTADVTRTFPVSGRFSEAQAAVYRIVLKAQLAGIRAVRPGARWDAPHRACIRVLTRGMVELGALRGRVPKLIAKDKFKRFYMHGTSHWLGRDVHDAGAYQDARGKPVPMEPGMVLTVEPGLYFGPRDRSVPEELRGIGVRIEDDVLVTRTGNRVLTAATPKSVRDVEAACADGAARVSM